MKRCPNCQEKTIPLKWVLFNRSPNPDGKCIECSNCKAAVKKSRWFIFYILSADILVEGTWILLATAFLGKVVGSYQLAFFGALLVWVLLHFAVEYFAPLKVADESYCRGDMSRRAAFFALIFMACIIAMLAYCFVIQPLILGERFCS